MNPQVVVEVVKKISIDATYIIVGEEQGTHG
jgi:hypothetical protein